MMAAGSTGYKDIDTGKVMALHSAGWENGEIAEEMGVGEEKVGEVLQQCAMDMDKASDDGKGEKQERGKLVLLTLSQLNGIYEKSAEIGAKEALKVFRQEQKKEYYGRADRRLRNTKLLLRNYHMLKEHAERSVFGRTQMEESALDILESMMSIYDDGVIIESIKRSATRTAVIVSHIETMFELYAVYCEKSVNRDIDMRRYEVVWDMYMADVPLDAKEIAQKNHMSKDTVYKDLKTALERLTALIFGVDGLKVQ